MNNEQHATLDTTRDAAAVDERLTTYTLRVLDALHNEARQRGSLEVAAGRRHLAQLTGLSVQDVWRSTATLLGAGYLEVIRPHELTDLRLMHRVGAVSPHNVPTLVRLQLVAAPQPQLEATA